ncbi:Arsenical resistance operon trans-acting repressor ArsD [Pontiella desulfatans]|uniref:Arsenical resistance operon trans-acting repressor ArsD n=1 Tax=Pontiella desulfatans TaxID=2750659 RepID=A0A6C2UB48_PONDE|nr:arsenite efflux transporter metallochaperone ArsD [Pontiella desulfatans]VGO17392.1 Arsenical resistance operon trans-acting repressor ArsD [Pontiella desulfatans]
MKTLKIYDPAMCCSSGVCGPDVDTELVQLAGFLKNLDEAAVTVERYNLSQQPAAYTSGIIAETLKEKGTAALPLVLVDDEVVSTGSYPDLATLACLLGTSGVSLDVPDCSGCSGCC